MKTITFFGHRELFSKDIESRLREEIEKHIEEDVRFIIGTHGNFDRLAFYVCKEFKKRYPKIKITLVFTSLSFLQKPTSRFAEERYLYEDVETMIYEIEDEHFKNQITTSNKKTVDDSDLVICYVDMKRYKSGAKRAVKYAIKRNKPVINLFKEEDRAVFRRRKENSNSLNSVEKPSAEGNERNK